MEQKPELVRFNIYPKRKQLKPLDSQEFLQPYATRSSIWRNSPGPSDGKVSIQHNLASFESRVLSRTKRNVHLPFGCSKRLETFPKAGVCNAHVLLGENLDELRGPAID